MNWISTSKWWLLLAVFASLSACAPMPVWTKPGGSQDELGRVRYQCLQEAQQRAAASRSTGYQSAAVDKMVTNDELFNACMNSRGWYLTRPANNQPSTNVQPNASKQPNETPVPVTTQTNVQSAPSGKDNTHAPKVLSIKDSQRKLRELGYDPGPIDGVAGGKTASALKQFQSENGLPVTGQLDVSTATRLSQSQKQASVRPITDAETSKQPTSSTAERESQPAREKKAVSDL